MSHRSTSNSTGEPISMQIDVYVNGDDEELEFEFNSLSIHKYKRPFGRRFGGSGGALFFLYGRFVELCCYGLFCCCVKRIWNVLAFACMANRMKLNSMEQSETAVFGVDRLAECDPI